MDEREMDESEQRLREHAKRVHNDLIRAQETASQLPPLYGIRQGEEMMPCATCGKEATAYKMVESERVYICGECSLNEMDAWDRQMGQQRGN